MAEEAISGRVVRFGVFEADLDSGELRKQGRRLRLQEQPFRILALLRNGEVCVCHLQGSLRLPQPTISRHLAYLRKAGLAEARRDGVWMYYRLACPGSPVVKQVVESALHAMTHAESTVKDIARLEQELAMA